jgi:hypothetical protein
MSRRKNVPNQRNETNQSGGKCNVPPRCIIFEVLAFPLQHPAPNFGCSWMILSWVTDVFKRSEWNPWVDHMIIVGHKNIPFMIFRHHERSFAESVSCFQCLVCFALENACVCCVCFLNFTNNDRLQFTTRGLKIEICLRSVSERN